MPLNIMKLYKVICIIYHGALYTSYDTIDLVESPL